MSRLDQYRQKELEPKRILKYYAVTGTFHGSLIYAYSEGDARRIFHDFYKGESITHIINKISMLG